MHLKQEKLHLNPLMFWGGLFAALSLILVSNMINKQEVLLYLFNAAAKPFLYTIRGSNLNTVHTSEKIEFCHKERRPDSFLFLLCCL